MSGKLKHMDRAHRSENKAVDYSRFASRAQMEKLKSQARKPQSILSKALGGLRKVQDK